jgi:hypothetical protein
MKLIYYTHHINTASGGLRKVSAIFVCTEDFIRTLGAKSRYLPLRQSLASCDLRSNTITPELIRM